MAFDFALVPSPKLHFRQSNNCGRKEEKKGVDCLGCVVFVCALQWRECVDDGRRVFKGHSPRSSRDRPFYPSVSSQLLLSENDVSALSTQHFVILPIRTRQRFDTGNVQALVLYTSHSSCLPSLLLIGECRLVESRCFDLSDILFAPRRAWLCALVRARVRAFARSPSDSIIHLFSPGF